MPAQRQEITKSNDTAPADTTNDVSLPGTIVTDNSLVLLWSSLNGNPTTPIGWNVFDEDVRNGHYVASYWRRADQTEGSTVTITTAATPTSWCAEVHRFNNVDWASNPEAGTNDQGTSSSPDTTGATASWGEDENTFLTFCGYADDQETISAYPSGYTGTSFTEAAAGDNASSSIGSALLDKSGTGSDTDNPGAFTLSDIEVWIANTIVIRGLAGGASGLAGSPVGRKSLLKGLVG